MTDREIVNELLTLACTDDPEVALGWVTAMRLAHARSAEERKSERSRAFEEAAQIAEPFLCICDLYANAVDGEPLRTSGGHCAWCPKGIAAAIRQRGQAQGEGGR